MRTLRSPLHCHRAVFLSSPARTAGATLLVEADADATATGDSEYSWMGASLAIAPNATGAGSSMLLVGAPGYRIAGPTAVGRVYGYLFSHDAVRRAPSLRSPAPFPAPLFTVTAPPSYLVDADVTTKLGTALSVGRPAGAGGAQYAAIGATSVSLQSGNASFVDAAGAVVLVPLRATLSGDYVWSVNASGLGAATLASCLDDGRYGGSIAWGDLNGDGRDELVVAAPLFTPTFIASTRSTGAFDSGHEAGGVWVYTNVASLPPRLTPCAERIAAANATGAPQFARFGSSLAVGDWAGDGSVRLVVGSPRETTAAAETAGSVTALSWV